MSHAFLPVGSAAPKFSATAVYTGRRVNVEEQTGYLLLNFTDRHTSDQVKEVVSNLRRKYPDHRQLFVATVADLSGVPRLFQGMARRMIIQEYEKAAQEVPKGYDPADHIVFVADWDGKLTRTYGLNDLSEHMAMVLIDVDGMVQGSYQGPEPETAVFGLIDPLLAK